MLDRIVHLIPMASLTDWLTGTMTEVEDLVKGAAILALSIFMGFRALKAGGAIAAVIAVIVTAGLLYYMIIGDGLADIGRMMDGQGQANQ